MCWESFDVGRLENNERYFQKNGTAAREMKCRCVDIGYLSQRVPLICNWWSDKYQQGRQGNYSLIPLSALRHSRTELRATCYYVCSLKGAMYPVVVAVWVVADSREKPYFSVGVYRSWEILLKRW
jgi:hypothetical protein